METDKQLFVIWSAQPQWLFELTGLASPGDCVFESVTLKALERRTDGVVVPVDQSFPITVAETQFQKDARIYSRLVVEMALIQEQFNGREVQGTILFRSRELDPQTKPWNRVVQSFYLDELLESFAERSPTHPMVAVFRPLFEPKTNLEAHAKDYYHQITTSDLSDAAKEKLLDVFVSWLEQRFKDKGRKEIEMLVIAELPDLRETKSGQELFEAGREEGIAKGKAEGKAEGKVEGAIEGLRMALRCQIEAMFGAVGSDVEARIRSLTSTEVLTQLLVQLPKISSLDDLKWPDTDNT